ncbi:MAG: fumarate reductase subunit D [Deltaproteobacteria bacterium]|nr:fumarate reductase subunit D [Deltaproteobacteria bacterium]
MATAARSRGEAFWWALFSQGGVIAAMLVPIHIIILGFVIPWWWGPMETFSYERIHALLSHPIAKLYLIVLFSVPVFHCMHRIRHTLYDTGWRAYAGPIAFLSYGIALLIMIVAIATIVAI